MNISQGSAYPEKLFTNCPIFMEREVSYRVHKSLLILSKIQDISTFNARSVNPPADINVTGPAFVDL
jgi:hypothetical protein